MRPRQCMCWSRAISMMSAALHNSFSAQRALHIKIRPVVSLLALAGRKHEASGCMRLKRSFFELTPIEFVRDKFCNVRFMATLNRLCTSSCRDGSGQEWLLMHYRVKCYDRVQAFKDKDEDRYDILTRYWGSRYSKRITNLPLIPVWTVVKLPGVAMILEKGQFNILEGTREIVASRMHRDFGHSIGRSASWEQTCKEFFLLLFR